MNNPLTIRVPDAVPFIEFEREFDHPVEKVFRAHADPALVSQWLGPRGYQMIVEELDFRTGGRYRYTHRSEHGDFSFNGVFHVVRENELAIQTFEFEAVPDVVSIESMTLVPLQNGRCRLVGHSTYPSLEPATAWPAAGWSRA